MSNQVLDRKQLDQPGRQWHVDVMVVALVLLALLGAAIVAFNIDRNRAVNEIERSSATTGATSALPNDGRAYYTEPYWDMASEAAGVAPAPAETDAYFTEQYWKLAEASANAAPATVDTPAYFTEPYWQMAAEHQGSAASTDDEDAYYTEKYWDMARARHEAVKE
jgi:hypothetical protein